MSLGSYFTEKYISYKENNTFFNTRKVTTRPYNADDRQIYYNYIDKTNTERTIFSGWYDLNTERNISIKVGKLIEVNSRYCSFAAIGAEERTIFYIIGAKTVLSNILIGLSLKYNDERKCLSYTDFNDQRIISYSTTIYNERIIIFQRYQKTTLLDRNIISTITHINERNIIAKIINDFEYCDRLISLFYTNYNERQVYFYIYDKTVLFPTPCNSTIIDYSERTIYLQKKRLYDDRFILCQNRTFISIRHIYASKPLAYGYDQRYIKYSIEQMGRITTVTMIPGRYYWNEKYCMFRAISYNTERNIYYKINHLKLIDNFNKAPLDLIVYESKDKQASIEISTKDNIYDINIESNSEFDLSDSTPKDSPDGSIYVINIKETNNIKLEAISQTGTIITQKSSKINLIQVKSIKFKANINT